MLTPMIRLMHITNITPSGFINVDFDHIEESDEKISSCDLEFSVSYKNIQPIDYEIPTPFIMASFDIECTSKDGTFPQATRPDDKIIQIFTTFYRYGESEPYYVHACVMGETSPIEGVDMESFYEGKEYSKEDDEYFGQFDDEGKLLMSWQRMMRKIQPDVLLGYNILGFDLQIYVG